MQRITNLMMVLLRSEITGTELDKSLFVDLTDEDWTRLYYISKLHDLAHLVGDAVLKNKLDCSSEIIDKFDKQLITSVYRYQCLQYGLNEIRQLLNDEKIPFIPLKGAVLRNLYSQPWMRTSCDVDILIHETDLPKAVAALNRKGYSQSDQTAHDISFIIGSNVHLELHHSLIEEKRIGRAEQLLTHIWDYAKTVDDSSEYVLDDEMFYYYHLAHMAKHLEGGGGCGIRPFLDLWILNHKFQENESKRIALLSEGGLDKFAATANELIDCWMGEKELSPLAKQLEEFVITGGVYGSRENSIVIGRGKRKSKFRYLLNRIWMPYNRLIGEYPNLRGKRILQPLYEIRRWFRLFKKDTFKRSREELKTSTTISKEQTKQTTQMLSDLGLL